MLRGEAGVGKTSAAKAVACGLGRPMVPPITCHSDFEATDFLLLCVPVSEIETSNFKLPKLEDIQFDPPTAYHMLTGKYLEGVTEAEVYDELIKCITQKVKSEKSEGRSPIRYQESSFITAMRYG